MSSSTQNKTPWTVYMLRCADNSLYTGITTDLTRRLYEHNQANCRAARYTRSRRPVELVMAESVSNRSQACQREASLKRMSKQAKEEFLRSCPRLQNKPKQ